MLVLLFVVGCVADVVDGVAGWLALLTVASAGALMVAQSVVLPMVLMFVVDGVAGVVMA